MEFTLECQTRPDGSKPRALRRSGRIPAVLYGHKGTESICLTVDAKTVSNLLKDPAHSSSLIELSIPDAGWNGKTLLREVQTHPWKGYPYHLSFFAVAAHGDIDVEIPVRVVGEAVGMKTEGGILETLMIALPVKCSPDSIPDGVEIDISNMHVGDTVHVKDVTLPKGVEATSEPEQVVLSIQGTRAAQVEPTDDPAEETEEEV